MLSGNFDRVDGQQTVLHRIFDNLREHLSRYTDFGKLSWNADIVFQVDDRFDRFPCGIPQRKTLCLFSQAGCDVLEFLQIPT